jgi:hypothetical protein
MMKPLTKTALRVSVSTLLGGLTMFGIVMLTNVIGDWMSGFVVAGLSSLHIDISEYGSRVTYCALFGLWTVLFLILARLATGKPLASALPAFGLVGLLLCFVAPVALAVLYQSTMNQFGFLQDTYVTEWILFLEIVLIGIIAGIWWSRTRVTRFGT